jgi:Na+-transporting NADH:ubiquinone oxidoreductase subunit A
VITAINRGARRVLDSVVVRLQDSGLDDVCFEPLSSQECDDISRTDLVERLQQTGLWTAFRTRPFSRVPKANGRPNAIFVTAIDTRPLSADPSVVVGTDPGSLLAGLKLLNLVTTGTVYLCTGAEWDIEIPDIERLEQVTFSGPHPAGLPGTHIHHLYPVNTDRVAWHINYQDVMAIGQLFTAGAFPSSRVIALGGGCLGKPRLVKTIMGASTVELLEGGFCDRDGCRVVSGSVLDGRTASNSLAYLGRYHNQVSAIPEGGERQVFGWLRRSPKRRWSTSQNGRFAGMIPMPVFENVMPLDILPASLFRALLVKDSDQAQALGCLELDEEDLALSAYVCPAKTDYGHALRVNLEQIEREG